MLNIRQNNYNTIKKSVYIIYYNIYFEYFQSYCIIYMKTWAMSLQGLF